MIRKTSLVARVKHQRRERNRGYGRGLATLQMVSQRGFCQATASSGLQSLFFKDLVSMGNIPLTRPADVSPDPLFHGLESEGSVGWTARHCHVCRLFFFLSCSPGLVCFANICVIWWLLCDKQAVCFRFGLVCFYS